MGSGGEASSTLPTHPTPPTHPYTPSLLFRDEPLHFAEFIRIGEYDCFGTTIASVQLRKLQIATQKETLHGFD
jgi:hypothetical protein